MQLQYLSQLIQLRNDEGEAGAALDFDKAVEAEEFVAHLDESVVLSALDAAVEAAALSLA